MRSTSLKTRGSCTVGLALAALVAISVQSPALAQITMYVVDDKVGIGTGTPSEDLHIYTTTTTDATLLVENASGTTAARTLLKLINNGRIRFTLFDSNSGVNWNFQNDGSGNFVISKAGSGGQELNLDGSGNLTILGTLTQGSDRNAKEDIVPVDGASVLERVLGLPIAEWRYKADATPARHMGPMAQDFHQAFGLGAGDQGLSTLDTSGVALAAIQGLHERVAAKDRKIADLEARIAKLEALAQDFASSR